MPSLQAQTAEPERKPVRLVVSCLANDETVRTQAARRLIRRFGPLDYYSEPMDFDYSRYYEPEMGAGLNRRLAAFEVLVKPHLLAECKLICEQIEREFSQEDKRRVNLDPGLLGEFSLILATHKNAPHRIAISSDTWAELTLLFRKGRFEALPWTYRDYAGKRLRKIFFLLRERYLWQLKNKNYNREQA